MLPEIELTEDEILKRQRSCRERMLNDGLAGVVLTAESNIAYYTGYRTHAPWTTFTRPNWLFLPAGGEPQLYLQTFVAPEAAAVSAGCEVLSFDSLLGPTTEELAAVMKTTGMAEGKIGFELGFEQRLGVQADSYEALRKTMNRCEFRDASDLIWSQRIIKSPYEIECHRRACLATSYAFDRIFERVEAGMTEREVSRLAQRLMLEGGAEYAGFVIITSGRGNYGRISSICSSRKLENGDMLWLDLGAVYNGYWSDFCRAGVVGPVSRERQELQQTVHEITLEATGTLKPGVPVAEAARACGEAMERRGFKASFECGRMGHGMGLMSTEPPSVTIHEKTVLEEGMMINLEPGIVTEDGVYDLEENMVIIKEGCEILSGGERTLQPIKNPVTFRGERGRKSVTG